ncbi:class I SAM-dependent methyltransferase [Endozoicomonas numazuensis]|uniref:Tellurite resistance protein TehB n=1 Tax=Endozoicomonas numazuensis TaxID=1137799 RepID=A0A081N0Z3_9GAMM|nr:class I SAM-dependent methyltransferase [Endozoicomonas numazuensis]KEQ12116.1 Tellurite resistance protein TehB [Endozoicomonas numazuensis]
MNDFYDQLTPFYPLIFEDWDDSIEQQSNQLHALIRKFWPDTESVLDVSCGIGTQAIGLAQKGYKVTASDLSEKEAERARQEADERSLNLDVSVCDMRQAFDHHGSGFDLVISADNSVPHLLNDNDILTAFKQMFACLKSGGGCLITVRDYEKEERGRNLLKPYGVRVEGNKRYILFQVWDFEGDQYSLAFHLVEEDLSTGKAITHTLHSRYYAISTDQLCELMREAGFKNVQRLDNVFYQPVIIGTK